MTNKTADIFNDSVDENMASPELVYGLKTTEDMYSTDTSGDPVGTEERAKPALIQLPDHYYRKYDVDGNGDPTFSAGRVAGIKDVLMSKKDTPYTPLGKDDEQRTMNQKTFQLEVDALAESFKPLLLIDPQTTGINFLQLTTRTWAEFVSIAYEYNEAVMSLTQDQEMPTWLIDREDKMFDLGRKARLLSAVVDTIDNAFGLKDVKLNVGRVLTEVERRQQRLAEWNYKNSADASRKVSENLNTETIAHCQNVFASA
jgi:hypothetical protein|tara:strand:- start:605 stop:1375 length:771 start_codon:yes stop_codon:yes gene_type:complete